MRLAEFAPAKVNLFLHVGTVGPDGRHPLCSLVAFADIGDVVEAELSNDFHLDVDGPFSDQVGPVSDNLVARALVLLGAEPMRVSLTKKLPVAAGIGGGTSDAGAVLRLAGRLSKGISEAHLEAAARSLGADGLMCLKAKTCLAQGEGERLSPAPEMPVLPAVLVNPRVHSPTGSVYRAYDDGVGRFEADRPRMPSGFATAMDVADFLARQRNDLEAPAMRNTPAIATVRSALSRQPDVLLTRMSGSGATVYGLFATEAGAANAALQLRQAHPGWWIQDCRLNV